VIALRLLVDGAVIREAVFKDGPVLVGRGPESDFVIVDPSVSRQHARVHLDESGTAWIEDAGSRNGLRIGEARVARAAVPPTRSLRCHLGAAEVELALLSSDATVELPAHAAGSPGPRRTLRALALWVLAVSAWGVLVVITPGFWSPWQEDRLTGLSWTALGAAVGLPMLAFVLVGMLRVVGRRARVSDSLRALAIVSWGWVLVVLLAYATSYALSVAVHGAFTTLLMSASLIVSVAYLASVARPGPRRRFFLTWLAATGLLLAGFYSAGNLAARQAGTPQVDYDVAVPIGTWTGPASDLDRHLEVVRENFKAAERRAEEDRNSQSARP